MSARRSYKNVMFRKSDYSGGWIMHGIKGYETRPVYRTGSCSTLRGWLACIKDRPAVEFKHLNDAFDHLIAVFMKEEWFK